MFFVNDFLSFVFAANSLGYVPGTRRCCDRESTYTTREAGGG